MVRSKSKLEKLLAERGISADIISAHLTIVEGNVKDIAAVSQALRTDRSQAVDIIISGIGSIPTLRPNLIRPVGLNDDTICQDATKTILAALRALSTPKKPLFITLSTTGLSDEARDVPIALVPLYHWLLAIPHMDKKEVERLLAAEVALAPAEQIIRGFIVIRPSLLTDGKRLGLDNVRVGREHLRIKEGDDVPPAEPAIGYTISREDVGGWIFDKIVHDVAGADTNFVNKFVTLTY